MKSKNLSSSSHDISITNKRGMPQKLQELMELINGLPQDAGTWDILIEGHKVRSLYSRTTDEWGNEDEIIFHNDDDREVFNRALAIALPYFLEIYKQLSIKAQEFIGLLNRETDQTFFDERPMSYKGFNAEDTMGAARIRYEFLVNARETLQVLAQENTEITTTSTITLYTDKQGRIAVRPNLLVEALQGAEAKRIRQCLICYRLFWAGRIDQKCCTPKCANTYRVRLSRRHQQKSGEHYKAARIRKLCATQKQNQNGRETNTNGNLQKR